jgi:acetyltransferase
MINRQLLDPKSIVIVGGSNDITKPGGKILKNIIEGGYNGHLSVLNPKEKVVQGVECFASPAEMPEADLAIIAIASRLIPGIVESLIRGNATRAFIVISAGFSEENEEGAALEKQLVNLVNDTGASLIGPNCIGILTPSYHGVFTLPIPRLEPDGCDFISGSGATACFIMENGIPKGLTFSRVFSVGNSAQMGVEDILQYMDETYDEELSPKVKLLYLEAINNPAKLLKHAASLIRKGCRIAAIKAGTSEAGSRAASSHTGALSSSDMAVDALFQKAGIIRCYGREELVNAASILMNKSLRGRNIGIISHAGGPAVMLTDALSDEGFSVPKIESEKASELLEKLFPGSSVANPIDFLATGTAEQLGLILDYCDNYFDEIDAMAVIFGTPGLTGISDVYELLHNKILKCRKPIFPILPSVLTAREEVREFIQKGHNFFPDEVLFAKALGQVYNTPSPLMVEMESIGIDRESVRKVIAVNKPGYLPPVEIVRMLDAAGITRVPEVVASSIDESIERSRDLGFPLVMKVIGPVHKSDIGGVVLNINTPEGVKNTFNELMGLEGATAVLIQPMISGYELFVGATWESHFGHLIMCGMGGIMIEVIKDFRSGLAPVSREMAMDMIKSLKSHPLLKGYRGKEGIDIEEFANVLVKVSALLDAAPEIREMDINPLIGTKKGIYAVDTRIRIEK